MDKKDALEIISDGHTILKVEVAEEVCKLFGVPFNRKELVQVWKSDPPNTFKGLTMDPQYENTDGVYSLTLSAYVATKLGVADRAGRYFGRGTQARAYAEAIEDKLTKEQ